MNFEKLKYKANYYVLVLLAFVIPLERKLAPPLIILFLVTSLINHRFKKLSKTNVLLFTSLFFIYLFGVIFSEDKGLGLTNLVEKLSLFIFPLAIYVANINFKNQLKSILYSFVDGCLISGVISLIVSILGFNFTLDTSWFFYENSSYFLHPSYFAMYANFAIFIIYYISIFKGDYFSKKTILSFLFVLFFSVLIILSASKTGIIALIATHVVALGYWMVVGKKYLKGFVILSLISALFLGVFSFSSTIQNRVSEMFAVVSSGNTAGGSTTAARVEIWKISTDLIIKKPFFGYGTSNEKRVLVNAYEKQGFEHFAEKKLNAHNQFLQTGLAVGLIGLLVLLLMLIIPFYSSVKQKHYLYTCFILLIGFNFLTESMLERQAGVVFYSLFNGLFFVAYFGKDKIESVIKS